MKNLETWNTDTEMQSGLYFAGKITIFSAAVFPEIQAVLGEKNGFGENERTGLSWFDI